eukprot:gnl/Trimastix_PCT/3050.p1 GENE.gnl/Trimastix_PCT/3050~~gnl/Trimastix_PCT/3050.p1  ORF type:complete len:651 (+),score=218.46 gnl/Trimastix_PCT/3050:61-2013(+)
MESIGAQKNKIVSREQVASLVPDGAMVGFTGFIGSMVPEEVAICLEDSFKSCGHPRNLSLVYAAGQGDSKLRGLNHLGHEGMVSKVIGGHWGLVPKLQQLAVQNKIQAYNLPQGIIAHLFRDIAAHKPGTLSSVGLGTFVDPRNGGGKLNACTTEDIVEVLPIHGKDYLFYKAFPIDVAIVRGTTADLDGNVTMEREALTLEAQALAMAAKNSGGIVIVQVETLAERNTLPAREVKIPGILVDAIVVGRPENHMQTFALQYDAAFSSQIRVPAGSLPPMPLTARKAIARRAAFELQPNAVVNLGIGMPEGVAAVAAEEHVGEYMTLTAEPGVIGGIPQGGLNFGTAVNASAVIDQPAQFDFYDGGGLDLAFLGMAETDRHGNVNVSKFGPKIAGAGGFINISQNAKRVIFMGTFTAQAKLRVAGGQLVIDKEGPTRKFVESVEHVTFSGPYATEEQGKTILYITERCVLRLTRDGFMLCEIAPGVDLERDILAHMAFRPKIADPLPLMDAAIFQEGPMGLRDTLLRVPLADRFLYKESENRLYVNFEGLRVQGPDDIAAIREHALRLLAPLGRRVDAIVNYDHFTLAPEDLDAYTHMVKELTAAHYASVSRFSTGVFMRMKLGESLASRGVSPHIYESREEAVAALEVAN